jgi:hypothetical protein
MVSGEAQFAYQAALVLVNIIMPGKAFGKYRNE